ncbi:MAG: hypothetical protein IT183_05370 [Acidobacteria bacterium]|nr:hypothetical protein [Acidobacteriota bacterium]
MSTVPAPESRALEPLRPDANAAHLAELEARLGEREAELDALKLDLRELQTKYLTEIGALYRDLNDLEAEALDAEVRAGLRPPPADADEDEPVADAADTASDDDDVSCGAQAAPSDMLKRVFRDVAKNIHPDRAVDEAARLRRHSLMAEANRAYAERDHDRLLLILRRWERSPDSVPDDDPDAERRRVQRRIVEIEERLGAIDAEFIELRNSAIARLKHKIEETRKKGWDLFAEMVMQVKADIARAKARLVAARRMVGIRTPDR